MQETASEMKNEHEEKIKIEKNCLQEYQENLQKEIEILKEKNLALEGKIESLEKNFEQKMKENVRLVLREIMLGNLGN